MKTEPRVLMATGYWVDYVASGNVSLRLMAEKVEHKRLWMIISIFSINANDYLWQFTFGLWALEQGAAVLTVSTVQKGQ